MDLNFEEIEAFEKDIQAYLDGTFTAEARAAFEIKMQSNKALEEEVRFRQQLKFAHKNKDQIQFDQILKEVINDTPLDSIPEDNTDPSPPNSGGGFPKWILGTILSLAVLVGVYLFSNNTNSSDIDTAGISTNYFQPYENTLNFGANQTSIFSEAMRAYDAKEYDMCIELLESFTVNNPDEVALFYLANAYFEKELHQEALSLFQRVVQSNNRNLIVPSKWYQSLCNLIVIRNSQ